MGAHRKRIPPSLSQATQTLFNAMKALAPSIDARRCQRQLRSIQQSMVSASPAEKAVVIDILRLVRPSPYTGKVPSDAELRTEKYFVMQNRAKLSGYSSLNREIFRVLMNETIAEESYDLLEGIASVLKHSKTNLFTLQNLYKLLHPMLQPKGTQFRIAPNLIMKAPRNRDFLTARKATMLFDSVVSNKNFIPMASIPFIAKKGAFVIDDILLAEIKAISRLPMGKVMQAAGFMSMEERRNWMIHGTEERTKRAFRRARPKKKRTK